MTDDPGRYSERLSPRDRARRAEADREVARSLERGDEPTGARDVPAELRELVALRRRMADLEELRATDLRLLHELREGAADRVSHPGGKNGGGNVAAFLKGLLFVVATTVSTITWFEVRAGSIAAAVYDGPERAVARTKLVNDVVDARLVLVASRVDVAVQQSQLAGIVERLGRIEGKLDQQSRDRRRQ